MIDHAKDSAAMNKTFASRMKSIIPLRFREIYDIPDSTILPKWIRQNIYEFIKADGEEVSLEFVSDENNSGYNLKKNIANDSSTMRVVFLGDHKDPKCIRDILEIQMSNKKLEKIFTKNNKIDEITFKSNKVDLLPRLKKEAMRRSITLNDLIMTALEKELRKTYYLNKALEIDPDDQRALYSRAQAYLKMGHYNLSLNDSNRLVELVNINAFNIRAAVYFEMGKFDEAKKDIKEQLKFDSTPRAHYMLGKIYFLEGQKKYGIREMKIAQNLGSVEAEDYLLSQGL